MNRSPLHWLTSDISQWDPDICHKISWKTSQASRLYSLVTEVDQPGICGDIWNHHSVSSIVHILWAAKCTHHKKGQMVCCWKGMENLQCGSQNHHVCHIAWLKAYLHLKSPNFKCFLSRQFLTSKPYALRSNRSVLANFEYNFFMGARLPDFREEQVEK